MLSLPDLAGFDLPALRTQVQNMAVRQDRYRREALSIGVSPDCPETFRLVQMAESDAAALADLERLIAAAIRFASDESSGRPAPVLRLVPRPPADPASPSRDGLVARAFAALRGAPLKDTAA